MDWHARALRRRSTVSLVAAHSLQQSPRYLVGSIFLGVLGILIPLVPYTAEVMPKIIKEHTRHSQKELTNFDIPPTISDLVSRWDTVEARIFFGFELVAAILLLLSEYPLNLRNACCTPDDQGCCISLFGYKIIDWATVRLFFPPLGLLLVALCPTVAGLSEGKAEYTVSNIIISGVHMAAAQFLFVGFLASEAHVLGVKVPFINWAPCSCPVSPLRPVREGVHDEVQNGMASEFKWRICTWTVAFVSFVGFVIVYLVLVPFSTLRRINFLSFVFEATAALAMWSNLSVIWYFCRERKAPSETQIELRSSMADTQVANHASL